MKKLIGITILAILLSGCSNLPLIGKHIDFVGDSIKEDLQKVESVTLEVKGSDFRYWFDNNDRKLYREGLDGIAEEVTEVKIKMYINEKFIESIIEG